MSTSTITTRSSTVESINPATETVLASFEQFTPDQVEQALVEADAAFRDWRRYSFGKRSQPMQRAAELLRNTDRSVADICFSVGLKSVGSFTTSFTRSYGVSPTAYRAAYPPAADQAQVPTCVLRVYGRPQRRTFREDNGSVPG